MSETNGDSTRLIVKGLPKSLLKDDRLRDHFSTQGQITDVRIMRTPDGHSRQFAFIGYKTSEEARNAQKYFDKTYFNTSKLIVSMAVNKGENTSDRAWSKYTAGTSAYVKRLGFNNPGSTGSGREKKEGQSISRSRKSKRNAETILAEAIEKDPRVLEYLEVMKPRSKALRWANDESNYAEYLSKKLDVVSVPSKKRGGEGITVNRIHARFDDTDDEEGNGAVTLNSPPLSGIEKSDDDLGEHLNVGEENIGGSIPHLSWLRNVSKAVITHSSSGATSHHAIGGAPSERQNRGDLSQIVEQTGHDIGKISRELGEEHEKDDDWDGRLFIKNVPYSAVEGEICAFFGRFGSISNVSIIRNKESGNSRGLAYVLYMIPENAERALASMNGAHFQGRVLSVEKAKLAEQTPEEDVHRVAESQNFKRNLDRKRKDTADVATHTWSTLFVRPETVTAAMEKLYAVKRSDLLDLDEDETLAVRSALAESQVLVDTKAQLRRLGVNVSKLEEAAERQGKVNRGYTCIIVKNLPPGVDVGDVRDLFSQFSEVSRVVLPETGALGIVEFKSEKDALTAFKKVAWRRLKHCPLYLEWAPANIFAAELSADIRDDNGQVSNNSMAVSKSRIKVQNGVLEADQHEGPEAPPRSLFVKGLHFTTNEKSLRAFFEKVGAVLSCRIARRPIGEGENEQDGQPTGFLSRGFGFVEFVKDSDSSAALRLLSGKELDGKAIFLERAQGNSGSKESSAAISSTKLIVRNVAFEANQQEIRKLFSNYGDLRSLRLPRKFDGGHRGFAFIDYSSIQEAKAAKEALTSAHFYGRRLILEWASTDDGVSDALGRMERTKSDMDKEINLVLSKKRKRDKYAKGGGDENAELL